MPAGPARRRRLRARRIVAEAVDSMRLVAASTSRPPRALASSPRPPIGGVGVFCACLGLSFAGGRRGACGALV